ncbi:MAG: M56 family metallopeptidase [Pseudohongiellaceae bacterium]
MMETFDYPGSFAVIWLALWFCLSILFVMFYPLVRTWMFKPHPRAGSLLLLAYWSAPALLSLISSVMLFMPSLESLLVDDHCHTDCAAHVPVLGSTLPAMVGLGLAGIITVILICRMLVNLAVANRLQAQFKVIAQANNDYRVIDAAEPMVFTLGWWLPEIYVSTGLIRQTSHNDMEVMLCHETEHRRRRDNLRLLLARIFGVLLPAGFFRQLLDDVRLLTEQACDFKAADYFGEVAVAETLLRMQRVLQGSALNLPVNASAFLANEVEARITAVLDASTRQAFTSGQLAGFGTVLLVFLLFTIEPLHHISEWLITLLR